MPAKKKKIVVCSGDKDNNSEIQDPISETKNSSAPLKQSEVNQND
jgi:hypothetical protein